MSDDNKKITIKFGGIPTLLAVAFIILKLCNVITWSWVWILAPVWIPCCLSLIVLLFLFILFLKS